jgi:hypothetical protein
MTALWAPRTFCSAGDIVAGEAVRLGDAHDEDEADDELGGPGSGLASLHDEASEATAKTTRATSIGRSAVVVIARASFRLLPT